jgi:Mn2+/Fe2+ NRAMP family transporter
MLWPVLFTYPLMVAVQAISARVGRVTGQGLAFNLRQVFPRWTIALLVISLFVANTINIGADIAAMGASAQLLVGRGQMLFTIFFAAVSLLLQVLIPYRRYVKALKWLTLVLLAYVLIALTVKIEWAEVGQRLILPKLYGTSDWVTLVVAVFGTTISPYLFFWQSAEEVEIMDIKDKPPLTEAPPPAARHELQRMGTDTFVGMGVSNLIAFFIILTTAVTLHQRGVTDIQTSAQAAEALRPVVGSWAFIIFSLGIIGTGLLAIPVLAGSTAYAAADTFDWPKGLERPFAEARAFYAVIIASMIVAVGVLFSPLDPIKALFWSAVINGIIAVPIMAAMMVLASRRGEMGVFVATTPQRLFGWAATAVMAVAVVAMFLL